MAPGTHFSLAWEKYRNVMCSGFSVLQQNGEFVDMTIAADGHLVKVHQMIVGLASPYLKELIQSAPCPHPVIFLNNVSHRILCSILEYVYTGEVAVEADKLTLFVETAKALHIKGLEDMLQYTSETHMSAEASAAESLTYMEPIQVQTITKPGSNTLQLQVLGERQSDMVLPATARNIVVKRDMPLISPVPEKKRMLQETKVMSVQHDVTAAYMREEEVGGAEPAAADDDDDEHDTSTQLESAKDFKLSAVVSSPSSQQHGDLQYTVSNRGSLQLILNRYMYNLASRSKNGRTRRWKCVDYRNNRCPASATTEENVVSSRIAMHNHPFHDKRILAKIEKRAVFSAIKNAEEASTRDPDSGE